jgi:hypothetical protein
MGRAYGGWMLMTTTAFFVLKTAAEQGTRDSPGDTMIAKLRAAIASASIMHLLLIPGRLILEPGVPLYPGAFAVPWWRPFSPSVLYFSARKGTRWVYFARS